MSERPDLAALRRSIKRLQEASTTLDVEKHATEVEFKNLLREMDNAAHNAATHLSFWEKTKVAFGLSAGRKEHKVHAAEESLREWFSRVWTFGRGTDDDDAHVSKGPSHHSSYWASRKISIHKFILAAKRVGSVNQKLIAFERGFISTEGLKEREWYRHLGVAPGKWLGMRSVYFLFRCA